ncbi:MAG: helix-turn-helix domain-containing protein [Candidatus Thermoplasmatota archaeon]|nr:helix-turn-helix domain-containing protein [Candidatus Thermoplasmatota archaeon]
MSWSQVLQDAGLSEREAESVLILSATNDMRASELAKELGTTRLDAYNSLSRLQEIGIVAVSAERPMKFSCDSVDQITMRLIELQKQTLKRTERGLSELQSGKKGRENSPKIDSNHVSGPRFAVLKERNNIFTRIRLMAEQAEEKLVLLLGQFGILHLCRSEALAEVNAAAKRGIVVNVLAQLDRRTIRFFGDLDESINIRHSDDVSSLGVLKDQSEVIQFLQVEENPVGRGRDDAALVIESPSFSTTQENLVDAIWNDAVDFEIAKVRFTEEKIVDPLRLTVGEGSFLESFRSALGVDEKLPDEDSPFDPQSFLASGTEINEARMTLQTGRLESLRVLGIDIGGILRQVGNRIGQELAFSLRSIEGHVEFLNEMMDWWENAGLGEIDYDLDPTFHVKVFLAVRKPENEDSLPLSELDDGIIEGVLSTRYPEDGEVGVRRESGVGDEYSRYHLLFRTDNLIEI